MERFRIGNDITINWKVKKNGSEVLLSDKRIGFYMTHPRGRQTIAWTDYSVSGSTLTFVFKGEEQSVLGPYTLTIDVKDQSGKRILIKDKCKAFELVAGSCAERMDNNYYTVDL